ncbi:MAG: arylsulfatase [Verrucomicrobiales bacterium]
MIRAVTLFLFLSIASAALHAEKPNVIFILADDLGYGDLGCFGQKQLTTPHIDQLAAEGMRLTRHYAGSTVCAPSRCVLMTGLHTGHCSVRGNGPALLDPEDFTVAELMRENGYATACFGKWGIGSPPPPDDPNRHGFDEFYGYVNMFHAHNFYPEFLVRNGERQVLRNLLKSEYDELRDHPIKAGAGVAREKLDYAPDLIAAEALKFIDSNRDQPFFLYFALNIPHANNEGGRDGDPSRGMEVPHFGKFQDQDWPPAEKGFASMLQKIDTYTGQIVAKLREHGLEKKTLVIFSSDNGPHQEGRHKMEFFDSNGDLRGMKRDLYDGGIRVPTIAWFPGRIRAGSSSNHLSGFQDLMPTLAELVGAERPPTDGISMLPTLFGKGEQPGHKFLYWEFLEQGGKVAITDGRWKAILLDTMKKGSERIELYDLEADPAEANNVANDHPAVVGELRSHMGGAHRDL